MSQVQKIATVTLNPAIDQTVSIPGFRAGSVNRVQSSESNAGGKGVNVASFLADFGQSVAATGFLGRKNTTLFEELFVRKQIEDRFLRIAGSTRIGIKIIDETVQETTDLNFPGQMPTDQDVRALFETVEELTAQCGWFVLSGSIPVGMSATVYRDLVDVIKHKGCSVALDTSGESFREALSQAPDLIKPNNHELEEFVGHSLKTQDELIAAARQFLDRGIRSVVISMGEDGAIFLEGDDAFHAIPPEVTVVSTVGAGDAMVSGTMAGKVLGKPLEECARLATAFSLSAISRVELGLPDLESVQNFMKQVVVEKI